MNRFLDALYNFNALTDLPEGLTYIVPMVCSTMIGALLGWERERAGKPAGVRTFALVSLGASLFTLIGHELGEADGISRIIAQIVTGVGFIGGGAVIVERNRIGGLTTAATIWVSSALGVVFGLGYLPFGIVSSLVVLTLLLSQRRLENILLGPCAFQAVEVSISDSTGKHEILLKSLLSHNPRVTHTVNQVAGGGASFVIHHCSKHRSHSLPLAEIAKLEFVQLMKIR